VKRVEFNPHLTGLRAELHFEFTDEEKHEIRGIFKKINRRRQASKDIADPERLREFVELLEVICNLMKDILESSPERKKGIKAVLENCKNALPYLNQIADRQLILPPIRGVVMDQTAEQQNTPFASLEALGASLGELEKFNSECCRRASDAAASLRAFIEITEECLKRETRKRGLKTADYLRDDLLRHMARGYSRCTGKSPTSYKYGPFMNLVRIAYRAVGLRSADPSERVRAVLKALKREGQKNKQLLF
jgi:hypothetical protein